MYEKYLNFSFANRHYNIKFNFYPVIQLSGNSATGKSLFVHDFERASRIEGRLRNHLIIDTARKGNLKLIQDKKYDFIIIDNADIIITPEIDDMLFQCTTKACADGRTRYIIIGRKNYGCVLSPMSVGRLLCDKNEKDSSYYFHVDFTYIG